MGMSFTNFFQILYASKNPDNCLEKSDNKKAIVQNVRDRGYNLSFETIYCPIVKIFSIRYALQINFPFIMEKVKLSQQSVIDSALTH